MKCTAKQKEYEALKAGFPKFRFAMSCFGNVITFF
jgi:hypothetical protein